MKKIILIAGGAGFIGTNLITRLILNKNYKIICLDNLSCSNRKNIKQFTNFKNFKFIKHDITKKINIKCNEIYNLACPASPINYQKESLQTLKTNFMGTLNLLELAKKNNSKFLQASTSEVYGDPKVSPQNENYWGNVNTVGLRSCYDEGKRSAETLCYEYKKLYNLDIKIIRIFNTYGPFLAYNDGRVISNFIVSALNNNDLHIYGDGSQTRSFCYIDDLVNGFIKMMRKPKSIFGPINIGNPREIKIKDVANKIIKLTNSKSKITFTRLPENDPKRRKPDIYKANTELKWKPIVSLDEGLLLTIKYFKKII